MIFFRFTFHVTNTLIFTQIWNSLREKIQQSWDEKSTLVSVLENFDI